MQPADIRSLDGVIAETPGIPEASVDEDLGFRSIPEWDSIRHVELMLALEEHWGEEVDADAVLELTSVRAIRDFHRGRSAPAAMTHPDDGPPVHRGLSGVTVDETRISHIVHAVRHRRERRLLRRPDADPGRITHR